MPKKVTISTVAEKAGVSCSTVSHVLSGNRPISKKICDRVRRVIKKLGYAPNPLARGLALNKTMQIGVLIEGIANSISSVSVESIERTLREHGYRIFLGICGKDRTVALSYLREFSSGFADGVINMVPQIGAMEAVRECRGIPVITYIRPCKGAPVLFDSEKGGMLATEHLWTLGHRKIGLISVKEFAPEVKCDGRELGYRRFFAEKNVEVDEALVMPGDNTVESGYALADKLYKAGASAIFASNDMMAAGVIQWAHDTGVNIPRDLSVVGFDDSPVAQIVSPRLTSVQLPVEVLMEKTVVALIDRIDGKEFPKQEIIEPELIVRNSTGCFGARKT
ncbi:MAG: LacI family DNA-binding transcriptional regulator [Victivallales bacterium]